MVVGNNLKPFCWHKFIKKTLDFAYPVNNFNIWVWGMSYQIDGIKEMVPKMWRVSEIFGLISVPKSNCEWWDTAILGKILFFVKIYIFDI